MGQRFWNSVKRWPGVRHVRYMVLLNEWCHWWEQHGRYVLTEASEADMRYLDDVWAGKD